MRCSDAAASPAESKNWLLSGSVDVPKRVTRPKHQTITDRVVSSRYKGKKTIDENNGEITREENERLKITEKLMGNKRKAKAKLVRNCCSNRKAQLPQYGVVSPEKGVDELKNLQLLYTEGNRFLVSPSKELPDPRLLSGQTSDSRYSRTEALLQRASQIPSDMSAEEYRTNFYGDNWKFIEYGRGSDSGSEVNEGEGNCGPETVQTVQGPLSQQRPVHEPLVYISDTESDGEILLCPSSISTLSQKRAVSIEIDGESNVIEDKKSPEGVLWVLDSYDEGEPLSSLSPIDSLCCISSRGGKRRLGMTMAANDDALEMNEIGRVRSPQQQTALEAIEIFEIDSTSPNHRILEAVSVSSSPPIRCDGDPWIAEDDTSRKYPDIVSSPIECAEVPATQGYEEGVPLTILHEDDNTKITSVDAAERDEGAQPLIARDSIPDFISMTVPELRKQLDNAGLKRMRSKREMVRVLTEYYTRRVVAVSTHERLEVPLSPEKTLHEQISHLIRTSNKASIWWTRILAYEPLHLDAFTAFLRNELSLELTLPQVREWCDINGVTTTAVTAEANDNNVGDSIEDGEPSS